MRGRPGWPSLVLAAIVLGAIVMVARMALREEHRVAARLDQAPHAVAPTQAVTPIQLTRPEVRPDRQVARRIGGVVLLPDGRPAAGATVAVLRAITDWPEWQSEPIDQAVTLGDGAFEFRLEAQHGLLLAFEHPQHAGGLEDVPWSQSRVQLRLQPGFELRGVVTNDSGAPMANAVVAIESLLAEPRRAVATTTGASGAYRFTNLPGGPVRVVARHEWWQPAVAPAVVVGAVERVDMRFDRPSMAPLRGRVVAAATQAPIAGARIELLAPNARLGLVVPAAATSGADGSFVLGGLARGNHRVVVRHPSFGTLARTLAIGAATAEQAFELPPRSRLVGQVVDDAGAGRVHGGAVLEVRDSGGELCFATVDADGSFECERPLSPGWAELRVQDGAFAFVRTMSSTATVRIEERAETVVELPTREPTTVRGRVVDEQGRPLAGVAVVQTRVLAENARWIGDAAMQLELAKAGSQLASLVTFERDRLLTAAGADGSFEFRGLPPGLMNARFELPGHGSRWLRVPVPPLSRPVEIGDVVLSRGVAVRGRVLRGGRPVAGAPVSVVGPQSQAATVTRGDGSFVVPDMPPGPYRLRARFPSQTGGIAELVVADVAKAVDLELPAGRTLRGQVNGSDGQPVPGALVAVRGVVGQPVVTDATGAFALELGDKPVELQVSLGDRRRDTLVPVAADRETVVVTIDTPPTCMLAATVLGLPDKKRLGGVILRATSSDELGDRATWVDLQNGELLWPHCPTGRVRIEIWAEGFAPYVVERTLPPGKTNELGEIVLEAGSELHGRVVDPTGAPVADAAVFLGDESDLDLFEPKLRTAADGSFTVTGVTTRSARLVVRSPGFALRTFELDLPRDVLLPEPFLARLTLGATIEVIVGRPGARDYGMVQLLQRGRVVAGVEVDEKGLAQFANRGEGEYQVRLFGSDTPPRTVRIDGVGRVVQVRL